MDDTPTQQVDLTNCDREPIHIPGAVQPSGFLLVLNEAFSIIGASGNAGAWLDRPLHAVIGADAEEVLGADCLHALRGRLQWLRGPDAVERIFGLPLRQGRQTFDLAVHVAGQAILVEAEPSVPEAGLSAASIVRSMVGRLQQTASIETFLREGVRQMRGLTGFDRVMIYRFAEDGSGEVIAESAAPGLEPYLGLHYPASDIPRQARTLYERNWLRIIADVSAERVPLVPPAPLQDQPLDLSLSILRSVSPIHIEYLQNIGVQASMSVSILREGRLWGLFACHHLEPARISFEKRTACELYGQMFSLLLETRERERDQQKEATAREAQDRILRTLAADESPFENIASLLDQFCELIDCDGMAVSIGGEARLQGSTPTSEELGPLLRFLNTAATGRIYTAREIGAVHEAGRGFVDRAAGLLAIPISRSPRDYLIFFRKEIARSVNWAGNPDKAAAVGPNGDRLTPRKSFEAWREVVRGQSAPWTALDVRIAESLRISLLEVVLRLADLAERERRATQERQELLIAELNHRVRNILSLIRGLIAQSRNAETVDDFVKVIGGRIQALARAHDQITTDNWRAAPLRGLIQSEAAAYLGDKADRLLLEGPNVLLDPQAFTTLALVIHELMTNSAKYGALCDRSGSVAVTWTLDQAGALELHWEERNGPPVKPPSRRGFGTTIIERAVGYDLKGESEIHYELMGVRARFLVPAAFITLQPGEPPGPGRQAPAEQDGAALGGSVLLVEDNMIIALDAEEMLLAMGAGPVRQAASVSDALRFLDQERPDFAVLDVNLGSETSLPVAERLAREGVPFVFATGYGEALDLPPALRGRPLVKKPFTSGTLRNALTRLGTAAGREETT